MISLAAEHEKLVACLEQLAEERTAAGLPTVAVFDGDVPDDLETDDAGRVLPYVVVWGSVGAPVRSDERTVLWAGSGDLDWTPQVTVAAGLPVWVIDAMDLVRDAVAAHATESGQPLVEQDGGPRTPIRDPDDSRGTRFYAVLPLRAWLPT